MSFLHRIRDLFRRSNKRDSIEQVIENTQGNANIQTQAGHDAYVTVNYIKSKEYKDLLAQRD